MRHRLMVLQLALLLGSSFAFAGGPFVTGGPVTTDNDASCDISVAPAATLLLPYFEVDIESARGTGEVTIFTIINTSHLPQIGHVTLWTDYDFPVIAFNVYLTGYDVQSINLYDVIARGLIAPHAGTGSKISPVGDLSGYSPTAEYNNPLVNERSCASAGPVQLTTPHITRMQQAFTVGRMSSDGAPPGCGIIGGPHSNAVGYATVDVVGACTTSLPTDQSYFASEIRFDNVLTGDYQQVNGNEDFAQGGPMVHVRAIPEGRTLPTRNADRFSVNSPRTFYSRFQPASNPRRDARQPLPATFAARWISGGPSAFETFFKIWREGRLPQGTACNEYWNNASLDMIELVRFDEEENPTTVTPTESICTPIVTPRVLPVVSLAYAGDSSTFPDNPDDAVGGWMYMNLDYCNRDDFASQNWVITSMRGEGRFSVDADAAALGNGCTGPTAPSDEVGAPIGPAPNSRPRP